MRAHRYGLNHHGRDAGCSGKQAVEWLAWQCVYRIRVHGGASCDGVSVCSLLLLLLNCDVRPDASVVHSRLTGHVTLPTPARPASAVYQNMFTRPPVALALDHTCRPHTYADVILRI